MGIEHRLYRRIKFRWPATILTADKILEGITRNVSANGAFMYYHEEHHTALPLELNQEVALVIRPPDRLPILIRAKVAWSDFLSSDEDSTLLGVGLQFVEIFYADRQFLRNAIAEQSKK